MNLLKNIKKEFILNNLKFRKQLRFKPKNDFGKITCKVKALSLDSVAVKVLDIENSEAIVDETIKYLVNDLNKSISIYKNVCNKIIKEWDTNPSNFKLNKSSYSGKVYMNKNEFLNQNEIAYSIFIGVPHYFLSYDERTCPGYGGDSFFDKQTYIDNLAGLDAWEVKARKELSSKKVRTKLGKGLTKDYIDFPLESIEDYLSLTPFDYTLKSEKTGLPMEINGAFMNELLNIDDEINWIDELFIENMKEEYDEDWSKLLDWGFEGKAEEYHKLDNEVSKYQLTFISPEGHEYVAYNDHSLKTGWNFKDEPIIFE